MDLFELDDKGIVRVLPQAKEIPELKNLYELDKSKDKSTFNKEIQYVWHMCNGKSPYEAYPEDVKEHHVINDFIKDSKWKASEEVKALVKRYLEIIETPSKRLLKACRKAVADITHYLNTAPIEDIDYKVKYMKEVGKIVESFDKIEERVKKEMTTEEKLRGGGHSKLRER